MLFSNKIREEFKLIFVLGIILYCFTSISFAMEDTKIERIIHEHSPSSFHNYLHIIDEIKRNNEEHNEYLLPRNEKIFIFSELADYLQFHGRDFLRKWRDKQSGFEEIRQICQLCIEDDCTIDPKGEREEEEILFFIHVGFMRIYHRFTLEDFAFYTFFKPCLDYYAIVSKLTRVPYEYDQKAETVKSFFRKSFPNTTLVEGCEKQQELVLKECPPVVNAQPLNGLVGKKTVKMIRSLSGKDLSKSIRKRSMIIK